MDEKLKALILSRCEEAEQYVPEDGEYGVKGLTGIIETIRELVEEA